MNILGIETSCDETAAAIVQNGKDVLSNVVSSSLRQHKKYGGIIPEIASRQQVRLILPVIRQALQNADKDWDSVHAIAVTHEPGLIGSLLVGLACGRALSYALKKPLITVNHVEAHLYAAFLRERNPRQPSPLPPRLPAIGLIVSGGHTNLYHIKDQAHIHCLGQTRDDAAGEAFDKVGRILDVGYPGGPAIDRLARQASRERTIRFPDKTLSGTLDFSFSGIKTAVLYYTQKNRKRQDFDIRRVAFAFQESVISDLLEKAFRACRRMCVSNLVIGGGVAANSRLRALFKDRAGRDGIRLSIPNLSLCTDNAAMIAGRAYHVYRKMKTQHPKKRGRRHAT